MPIHPKYAKIRSHTHTHTRACIGYKIINLVKYHIIIIKIALCIINVSNSDFSLICHKNRSKTVVDKLYYC